ncbi:Very-long-chain (3R)-3-hydroxyacyl-CoA dehydratase PASTICCINO 2A [Orobanche hederae]
MENSSTPKRGDRRRRGKSSSAAPDAKRRNEATYYWTVFFSWFQVFYLAVKTLSNSGHQSVYAAVEKPLLLSQSAALLEILHGLTGIVRSTVIATLP